MIRVESYKLRDDLTMDWPGLWAWPDLTLKLKKDVVLYVSRKSVFIIRETFC